MRTIVLFDHVSADGYFASNEGSLSWVVGEESLDREAAKGMPENDTILFGRKTYEMFESFWRPVAEQDAPTAPDPHSNRRSEGLRSMARWIHEANKVVWSRTLQDPTWKNTRVLRDFDAQQVESMKRESGKGIIVFGSGSIASQLVAHHLVDECRFIVNPTILGDGKTLIRGLTEAARVQLRETKSFPSGHVLLHYTVVR